VPIYDIKCRKCGNIYEDFGIQGDGIISQKCSCGGKDFDKVLSAPALRFHGEGFQTPTPKGSEDK
jgi:putative FmdB family regulatory protein